MYTKTEPRKVDDKLVEIVASALDMDYQTHRPQVLAVAVANRFQHESSDPFKDNPKKIDVLETDDPVFKVLLTYKHPFGMGEQRYCYTVNTEEMQGQFTFEHYHSMR